MYTVLKKAPEIEYDTASTVTDVNVYIITEGRSQVCINDISEHYLYRKVKNQHRVANIS